MMPKIPMSSTCLAIHWFISPPLGGMRTMGVTLGASVPPSRIWRRSSMYWRASRSAGTLMGACSISKAIPSRDEPASALAVSMSVEANPTKAVLPSARALMTPLRRGMSAMTLHLAGHEFGHPHVEDGGDLIALHGGQRPPDGGGHLAGIGHLLAVGAAGRGLARVVRAGIEPAPGEIALLGRVALGVGAQDFLGARAVAAIVPHDEQHGSPVKGRGPHRHLGIAEHPRAVPDAGH